MKHFVGLDLGTQSMKGLLLSPQGEILARATSEYLPDFPKPGWAENNTNIWITALKEILASLKSQAGISADDIGSLAIAAQNGAMVPIDRDCNAIDNCILWLDKRSEPECEYLLNRISSDEARRIVGAELMSGLGITKVMWFKRHKPDVYKRAYKFVDITPFLVGYLTGNAVCDYGNATWTLMFDVVNHAWSEKMLDAAEIDPDKMCQVRSAYEIAGAVRPQRAEELGLSASTLVAVGGCDLHAGMLGCGLDSDGKILEIAGTAEIVAAYTKKPVFDTTGILGTHLPLQPGFWSLEQGCIISGGSVRWHRDMLARTDFDSMDMEAAKIAPGSDGLLFLPYLSGAATPKVMDHARGVFFGLTMNHTLPHMTRAVYEGCTFGLRDCVERLDALGCGSSTVISSGGGTKSELWCQMKADALGKTIQVVTSTNATPLGAAILAGVVQGNFKDSSEAVGRLVSKGRVYEPDPANKAAYDDAYGFYKTCVACFEPLYSRYRAF